MRYVVATRRSGHDSAEMTPSSTFQTSRLPSQPLSDLPSKSEIQPARSALSIGSGAVPHPEQREPGGGDPGGGPVGRCTLGAGGGGACGCSATGTAEINSDTTALVKTNPDVRLNLPVMGVRKTAAKRARCQRPASRDTASW